MLDDGIKCSSTEAGEGHGADVILRDSVDGLAPSQLTGFFAGWRRPVSPQEHLSILEGSQAVVVALDPTSNRVVGFVTALTDGVLCAHITLLEVLPQYRGRRIGQRLVRRVIERLHSLYAIDVVCDQEVLPFYEKCGMTPAVAALRRSYG